MSIWLNTDNLLLVKRNGLICFYRRGGLSLLADAGGSVIAGGAGALLEVEATAAAADAERVRLVPALAEAARTLPLDLLLKVAQILHEE
uniref:Uncharacterized protein n=1 Tax=Zea mays TaxID=4577 RepID=C0P990_MAIZE|nr:unknown [Zea mays]